MLKLIKISYIAHGWRLALQGVGLVDEHIEAWQYGPVIPSLYHEFKRFRRDPIVGFSMEFNFESMDLRPAALPDEDEDHETKAILEKVWDVYKTTSGNELISRTHAEGTPWKKHYKKDVRSVEIPDRDIKDHYVELIQKLVA